jgi:hypothetical protein
LIVGVHAPEFTFEKKPENVAEAIRTHKLGYPIAQDNDFATWKAFDNHYWPAKYLIDAQGVIRYTHFGEAWLRSDRAGGSKSARGVGPDTTRSHRRPSHAPRNSLGTSVP